MLYEASTPKEYLSTLEDDWRKQTLEYIRNLILQKGPELNEHINYNMLGYGKDPEPVFHLNAQKHYVSLYVGNADSIDPDGTMLHGLDRGKGCIRFKKSVNPEDTNIEAFIAKTIDHWKAGGEVGC